MSTGPPWDTYAAHKHAAVRAQPALQSENNDGETGKGGEDESKWSWRTCRI